MFLGTLILSRFYDPASFGELGYYAGLASIVAVVSGLRFDYIVFSRTEFDKAVFFVIALGCAVCIHIMILVILATAHIAGSNSYKTSYWLLLFCISSSLFYQGTQMLIAFSEYTGFARIRLLQAIMQIVTGLSLYYIYPQNGLLLAFALSQLLVGFLVFHRHGDLVSKVSKFQAINCWRSNNRDAAVNSLIVLMQYSTPFAPIFIGSLFYSGAEVGAFFLFSSGYSAALSIFRRSVVNFLNGEVASPQRAVELMSKLKTQTKLAGVILVVIVVLGSFILSIAARNITTLVFGASWTEYSGFLLPIFLFFLLDALLQPFTTLLPLWGGQSVTFKYEVVRFVLVFFALPLLVSLAHLNFISALIWYFVGMGLVYIANIYSVYHWTNRFNTAGY